MQREEEYLSKNALFPQEGYILHIYAGTGVALLGLQYQLADTFGYGSSGQLLHKMIPEGSVDCTDAYGPTIPLPPR